MRIFVTGASGWIGSAVVPELLTAGHEVVGLARSDASAQRLEAAGAMIHRGDLDDAEGLVEAAPAGSVLHAVGDQGVPFREIAVAIGRHLDLPTKSVSPQEAPEHFGFLSHFAALDIPVSGAETRKLLGWESTGPSLLDDLEQDHYYRSGADVG